MVGLLVAVVIWWRTGVFNLFPGTAPLLEQLVFSGVMLSGLFAVIWLMAWQRIELHADTRKLRVANINTGYRWRTWKANDIAKIWYFSHSKSLGQVLVRGSAGTRDVAILEDSIFTTGPSRFFKEIAGFISAHNPDAEIAAALTGSSANQSDPN